MYWVSCFACSLYRIRAVHPPVWEVCSNVVIRLKQNSYTFVCSPPLALLFPGLWILSYFDRFSFMAGWCLFLTQYTAFFLWILDLKESQFKLVMVTTFPLLIIGWGKDSWPSSGQWDRYQRNANGVFYERFSFLKRKRWAGKAVPPWLLTWALII